MSNGIVLGITIGVGLTIWSILLAVLVWSIGIAAGWSLVIF